MSIVRRIYAHARYRYIFKHKMHFLHIGNLSCSGPSGWGYFLALSAGGHAETRRGRASSIPGRTPWRARWAFKVAGSWFSFLSTFDGIVFRRAKAKQEDGHPRNRCRECRMQTKNVTKQMLLEFKVHKLAFHHSLTKPDSSLLASKSGTPMRL